MRKPLHPSLIWSTFIILVLLSPYSFATKSKENPHSDHKEQKEETNKQKCSNGRCSNSNPFEQCKNPSLFNRIMSYLFGFVLRNNSLSDPNSGGQLCRSDTYYILFLIAISIILIFVVPSTLSVIDKLILWVIKKRQAFRKFMYHLILEEHGLDRLRLLNNNDQSTKGEKIVYVDINNTPHGLGTFTPHDIITYKRNLNNPKRIDNPKMNELISMINKQNNTIPLAPPPPTHNVDKNGIPITPKGACYTLR